MPRLQAEAKTAREEGPLALADAGMVLHMPTSSPGMQSSGRAVVSPDIALAAALTGRLEGDVVHFPRPIAVAEMEFTQAHILRDFRTGSQAKLLEMQPSGRLFISKFGDLTEEHTLMCAVRQMNKRWAQYDLSVCGVGVEAIAYRIIPLGSRLGLVEAVPESKTMYDLGQDCARGERHLRVLRELKEDPRRLDRLAATTVGYLTMCYALGIRDGHDDNLLLRSDGAFFRVDFGFAFGKTPEIDAPAVFVPRAVAFALGERRWSKVIAACIPALEALSGGDTRTLSLAPNTSGQGLLAACVSQSRLLGSRGDGSGRGPWDDGRGRGSACALNFVVAPGSTGGAQTLAFAPATSGNAQPPAWDLFRCVPEMGPLLGVARAHANTLSFEAFESELQQADRWSFARATKNGLREAMRYLAKDVADAGKSPKDWLASLDVAGLMSRLTAAGTQGQAGSRSTSTLIEGL